VFFFPLSEDKPHLHTHMFQKGHMKEKEILTDATAFFVSSILC